MLDIYLQCVHDYEAGNCTGNFRNVVQNCVKTAYLYKTGFRQYICTKQGLNSIFLQNWV